MSWVIFFLGFLIGYCIGAIATAWLIWEYMTDKEVQ